MVKIDKITARKNKLQSKSIETISIQQLWKLNMATLIWKRNENTNVIRAQGTFWTTKTHSYTEQQLLVIRIRVLLVYAVDVLRWCCDWVASSRKYEILLTTPFQMNSIQSKHWHSGFHSISFQNICFVLLKLVILLFSKSN